MEAGDWIAVGAAFIALGALVVSLLERRTREDEIDLLRRQVESDAQTVELLRRQVAGEEEARRAQGRAHLEAVRGSISWNERGVEYAVTLINAGPSRARDIAYWLENETGDAVTGEATTPVLLAGERRELAVNAPRPPAQAEAWLVARWRDDDADAHVGRLLSLPVRP